MTALATRPPAALQPTHDPAPVEKAVVEGTAADFEPETFLWINFRRPDGGTRIRYAWTTGGDTLGDHIDQLAMAAGLDAADWLHIGDRHQQTHTRGRVEIWAYPLRPVLADVQRDVRSPEERREGLRCLLVKASEVTGQQPGALTVRWLGFGPALTSRKD
ncbi:hypothetical protein AB0M58_13845 [Streptomyces bobili]|uniref:hypothetical protein n=1 Tax=Streptomyces bobili TaxID=67280 RepID=UPI00343FC453